MLTKGGRVHDDDLFFLHAVFLKRKEEKIILFSYFCNHTFMLKNLTLSIPNYHLFPKLLVHFAKMLSLFKECIGMTEYVLTGH